MTNLLKHIEHFLSPFKHETIYVACSGGIDSMVLLDALSKTQLNIHVLHVNYHLRGEDSNLDELLIENTCKQKQIPYHILDVDLKFDLKNNKGNLQDKARKIRYDFFEQFLSQRPSKLVIAHNQNDQIETFFINVARKSGIMGLSSMLPIHNNLLRPLLSISRVEIEEYADCNRVSWREDRSNLENSYQRNKWRNIFLPLMEKENADLLKNVLFLIEKFQQTQAQIEHKVSHLFVEILNTRTLSFQEFDGLADTEKFELLRQLNMATPGLKRELNKLRQAEKGGKITLKRNEFLEIIREESYFFFQKAAQNTIPSFTKRIVFEIPTIFNKESIYLNKSRLKGELKLRYWRIGDRMNPIGLKGSKLISAVLTDAKIPHHLRKNQLVLCDDTTIHWCVGLTIGRDAPAQSGDNIIHIEIAY